MALNSIVLDDCPVMLAGLCDTGRPEFFDYPAQINPGALFFVLEKTPRQRDLSYGELDMAKEGPHFFQRERDFKPAKSCRNVRECLNMLNGSSSLNA